MDGHHLVPGQMYVMSIPLLSSDWSTCDDVQNHPFLNKFAVKYIGRDAEYFEESHIFERENLLQVLKVLPNDESFKIHLAAFNYLTLVCTMRIIDDTTMRMHICPRRYTLEHEL